MSEQTIKGYIYIICSAVIYGCMPLMANFIYADGVSSLMLVLLRNILSVPIIGGLAMASGQGLRIAPRRLPIYAAMGIIGCALAPLLLSSSYMFMDSGAATVFHFVYPAVVTALGMIFVKSPVKPLTIISLLLCVGGILMFYTPGAWITPLGSLLSLASGVAFAIYVLLLDIFRSKDVGAFTLSFYVTLFSSIALLLACIVSGDFTLPSSLMGWVGCLFFVVAVNVVAAILFQRGTYYLGGQKASILSTLEPITSVVVGVMAFGEDLGVTTVIGVVLVVSASVMIALDGAKKNK